MQGGRPVKPTLAHEAEAGGALHLIRLEINTAKGCYLQEWVKRGFLDTGRKMLTASETAQTRTQLRPRRSTVAQMRDAGVTKKSYTQLPEQHPQQKACHPQTRQHRNDAHCKPKLGRAECRMHSHPLHLGKHQRVAPGSWTSSERNALPSLGRG